MLLTNGMAHTNTMVVQGIDLVGPTTDMTCDANTWYGPHQDQGGAGIDLVGPTTAMTYAANRWYGPHQYYGGAGY